jgi:hypothetical protein
MQAEGGNHPQALQSFQQAVANGDSASNVALYALAAGQSAYRKAVASKSLPDFQIADQYLQFSSKTSDTPAAALLLGLNSLSYGQALLQEAQKSKSCDQAKQAQAAFTTVQTTLPKAGKENPQAAGQALTALNQLSPYADQMAKAFCK